MTSRSKNTKIETVTSEPLSPPPQLELPFEPVPDNAVQQLLSKLFKLATNDNNIPAAKLLLDALKDKSADPSALTAEDALKILQEHFAQQTSPHRVGGSEGGKQEL